MPADAEAAEDADNTPAHVTAKGSTTFFLSFYWFQLKFVTAAEVEKEVQP